MLCPCNVFAVCLGKIPPSLGKEKKIATIIVMIYICMAFCYLCYLFELLVYNNTGQTLVTLMKTHVTLRRPSVWPAWYRPFSPFLIPYRLILAIDQRRLSKIRNSARKDWCWNQHTGSQRQLIRRYVRVLINSPMP